MTRVADLCKLSQKGYATSMVVTNHNKKVRCLFFACIGFTRSSVVVEVERK